MAQGKLGDDGSKDKHVKLTHETPVHHVPVDSWKNMLNLLFCSGGILICYFYYGIMQESVTRGHYGTDGTEKFVYTQALVFVQCAVNTVFAASLRRKERDNVPVKMYALLALTYLLAVMASNHALQFVPYPTQVLGKSCKPIPIMFFGFLFASKRYHWKKYICVLMIVIGVIIFLYKEHKNSSKDRSIFDVGIGELFLLISLAMDGSTGAIQDNIRRSFTTNAHTMMFYLNFFSSLCLLISSLLTGELFYFGTFVRENPNVLVNMLGLSIASALGQYFIFKTVAEFGPLTCSILTTTRKLFTILASVVFFGNSLTQRQLLGTAIVFTALILDAIESKKKHYIKSS